MLAATFKGKAVFLKVDTAAVKATSTLLGVRSLPTFMFFVKGRAITEAQFSGADQNKLATTLTTLATQAQREGVYANKVFTEKKVTAFLEALGEKKPGDPSATAKQLLADNVNKPVRPLLSSTCCCQASTPRVLLDKLRSLFCHARASQRFG